MKVFDKALLISFKSKTYIEILKTIIYCHFNNLLILFLNKYDIKLIYSNIINEIVYYKKVS